MSETSLISRLTQPQHCDYAQGRCNQDFSNLGNVDVLFLYPGEPQIISTTVEAAVEALRRAQPSMKLATWRELSIAGQVIFCEICKAMRGAKVIVADITTVNFNLLFEIGYAIGLGIPVIPIRDPSYASHAQAFSQLGIIDTIGYVRFSNSEDLANNLKIALRDPKPLFTGYPTNNDQPLYVVKSSVATEGQIRLVSAMRFEMPSNREALLRA